MDKVTDKSLMLDTANRLIGLAIDAVALVENADALLALLEAKMYLNRVPNFGVGE